MSGSLPIATSRLKAIDRIIHVLQAAYPAFLQALKDDPDLGLEDLYLPAPQEEAYYYQPYPISEMPINRDPYVVVFPSDARTLESRAASGPLGQTEFRDFLITVVLVFKSDGGNQFERLGKTLTTHDTHWLRAEAYTGALAHVISEYACHVDSIHKIELVGDLSEIVMPEKRKFVGVCQTDWRIKQNVLIPRRRKLPEA